MDNRAYQVERVQVQLTFKVNSVSEEKDNNPLLTYITTEYSASKIALLQTLQRLFLGEKRHGRFPCMYRMNDCE